MRDPEYEGLYRQALALALQARDEAEHSGPSKPGDFDYLDGIALQAERIRVTARLLEVMAWLARSERTRSQPPGNALLCLGGSRLSDAALPERLRRLLAHSRLLYLHVASLALGADAG